MITTRLQLDAYNPLGEVWQQSLANRFTHHKHMLPLLDNVEDVDDEVYSHFDFKLTAYMASLMDKSDPNCPIRLQYMPSNRDTEQSKWYALDSLGEEGHTIPGTSIVHRYPNRVLFLVTNVCGSYCRYCTRKRIVSQPSESIPRSEWNASVEYLRQHPEVEDVLLSGGDPLLLPDSRLERLLSELRAIPHIKFIRIGSRLPVQLPTRVTDGLCDILYRHNVQMLNIHINHPKEITPLLREKLRQLSRVTMLGNQVVLLKGVNDDVDTLRKLFMECISMHVRPYYVYSCDPTEGNDRFIVSLERAKEIYFGLRGHISGPAIPTFVVDGIGGLGKVPFLPDYIQETEDTVTVSNYEGLSVSMPMLKEKS